MATKHLGSYSKAAASRRALQAWDLRTMGYSWEHIAKVCEYSSASTACQAVRRWRQRLPQVDLERQRDEAVGRLGWLLRQAYADVEEDRPGSVTAAVRVEARLAELLGLDRPSEVVVRTPAAAELEAWVARVAMATTVNEVVEADVISWSEPAELGPAPD